MGAFAERSSSPSVQGLPGRAAITSSQDRNSHNASYSIGVAAHAGLNQFSYSMEPVCRSTLSRCTSELSTVTMSAVMVPFRFDVSDLQPLVVEASKLCAEIAAYVFGRQIHHRRNARPEHRAHAALHHARTHAAMDRPPSLPAPPAKPLFLRSISTSQNLHIEPGQKNARTPRQSRDNVPLIEVTLRDKPHIANCRTSSVARTALRGRCDSCAARVASRAGFRSLGAGSHAPAEAIRAE